MGLGYIVNLRSVWDTFQTSLETAKAKCTVAWEHYFKVIVKVADKMSAWPLGFSFQLSSRYFILLPSEFMTSSAQQHLVTTVPKEGLQLHPLPITVPGAFKGFD